MLYDLTYIKELLQFKLLNVWTLVDLPHEKRAIRTKWVFRNKKDQRGFVVRNKARLVAQGHRQEEGIDYDEVFAVAARIERRFMLANPLGFVDPEFPNKVYKVEKALYGLHQAPRACVKSASTPMKTHKPLSKDANEIVVDVHLYSDYAGASLNRKSTTGGCQFLGSRLISWKCKKQTIMVNSTIKAEYIATFNYCGQEVAHSRDYYARIMDYCQLREVQNIEHAQRDVAPEDGDSCS
nr:hypothetical protein [Tanacetum cinerariifolium]